MQGRYRQRALAAFAVAAALVTGVGVESAGAAFPGANGRIAYSTPDDSGYAKLFTVNPDGSDVRKLGSDYQVANPSWSPNGEWIAAEAETIGGPPFPEWEWAPFRVFSQDGTVVAGWEAGAGSNFSEGAAWSPDATTLEGAEIAFRGDCEIKIVTLDLTGATWPAYGNNDTPNIRQVTSFDRDCYGGRPQWSPDGEWILFDVIGEEPGIYVVHPDGSGLTRITEGGTSPTWSPDGTRIAFERCLPDGAPTVLCGIAIMGADGSDPRQITQVPGADRDPAWSPDGRYLVVERDLGAGTGVGGRDLWTIDLETGEEKLLLAPRMARPPLGGDIYGSDWQPLP